MRDLDQASALDSSQIWPAKKFLRFYPVGVLLVLHEGSLLLHAVSTVVTINQLIGHAPE